MHALEALEQKSAEPAVPPVDEIEPEPKPTMVRVWGELTQEELNGLAEFVGIPLGQLGLTKISTLLKAVYYKGNMHVPPYAQYAYQNVSSQAYQQGSIGTTTGITTGTTTVTIPNTYALSSHTHTLTPYAQTALGQAQQGPISAGYAVPNTPSTILSGIKGLFGVP